MVGQPQGQHTEYNVVSKQHVVSCVLSRLGGGGGVMMMVVMMVVVGLSKNGVGVSSWLV